MCKRKRLLAKEQEEMEIAKDGEVQRQKPGKEEVREAPKCTSEGAGYLLKVVRYVGETS